MQKSNWWMKWWHKQVNPWWEILLTKLNMLRNLMKTGKSKMLVILCWFFWNHPFFVPFPVHSVILECPRVCHSFSFLGRRIPQNLMVLKQNYCPLAFPRKKEGPWSCFQSSVSQHCILDTPTQQTLGRFTPNQVHWDQGSEVVHWPKDRVSHLADTVTQQTSGCFTPNQVIGHFAHPVHLRLPMSQWTGAVDSTITLQPLAGSLQMKFIFICAFHHLVKAI